MSEPALVVTMVRCSTVLLEYGPLRLLTDPWFGMHMRGLPCFRRPGLRPEELPELTALLVSHLHPDHWDAAAVRRLTRPPGQVLVPPGSASLLGAVATRVRELPPWHGAALDGAPEGVEVWAVPGPHTGPPPDEVSFLVRLPGWGSLFFCGDARLDRGVLRRVAATFGPVRLALLPVGGTRIFGVRTVMAPDDAFEAAGLLGAERVVPLHEGGVWMSVPPLSLHPGRARHLARRFAAVGQSERLLHLREGERAVLR